MARILFTENVLNDLCYYSTTCAYLKDRYTTKCKFCSVVSGGSQSRGHPSGYCDGLSSDVGSLISAQEGNHPSDFLRLPDSEETDGKFYTTYKLQHMCDSLSCKYVLYLLIPSSFLNSSMMASFCHNWDKNNNHQVKGHSENMTQVVEQPKSTFEYKKI